MARVDLYHPITNSIQTPHIFYVQRKVLYQDNRKRSKETLIDKERKNTRQVLELVWEEIKTGRGGLRLKRV